jgi:hypothetical protein
LLAGIGGVYCEDCDIASLETERAFGVRPYAVDAHTAEQLWQVSEKLTGLTLNP